MNQTVSTVRVNLGARSYDVVIAAGLIDSAGALIGPHLHRKKVAIVSERTPP